jgi:PleD family two-component response regulator
MINEKLSVSDENDNPPVSCSVGVAFGRIGLNVSDMFKRADTALYETKKNGRCGVTFFGNEKSA